MGPLHDCGRIGRFVVLLGVGLGRLVVLFGVGLGRLVVLGLGLELPPPP